MEDKKIRFEEINLAAIIRTLLKNIWVIALLGISGLLLFTTAARVTYTPQYTSTATFMVAARDSTSAYNSLTMTQSMATVFVEVFQSNVLREKIAQEMPNGQFDGTINTTTIPETNILVVTVTASQPDTAFQALTLAVENYSQVSAYVFANAQLEVIKDPVIPVVPSNPLNLSAQYNKILAVACVLAVGLIVLLYLCRDVVQTPKAARRKVDARLLRVINHEQKNKTLRAMYRRKNTAPLITNALISKSFIEDNLSLCSALEYHARKRGQQVIMVTSVGENEGKSTVAANLALAMAQKNRRVVLLDCDFRKPSLHKIFETPVDGERSITSYLLADRAELSEHLITDKKRGITLGISHHCGKSVSKLINSGRLRQLVEQLRGQADYVILDTPPMLAAADAESIAGMVDTAVLVVRADFMPTHSINEGLDRLRKSAPEVCGFVLNNYQNTLW